MTHTEIIDALLSIKQEHLYCEDDSWYSCPKAPEGCADISKGAECNCGADKTNATIDRIIAELNLKYAA